MQLEIDCLQRRLHRERRRATPSSCGPSSDDDSDLAIGLGPGLFPVSPFRVIRIIIIGGGRRVCLTKVWTITLWARLWIRFSSHLLPIGLKVENFLNGLLSQHSLCTMAKQTQSSTLVTSTRRWSFTLRMKPWYAKCSHPVWGLWQWDGSMVWEKVLLAPLRSSLGHLGFVLWLAVGFLGPWILYYLWRCERRKP